jgi:hypothetical protein
LDLLIRLTHCGIIRGFVLVAALGATPVAQSKSQAPISVVPPVGLDSLCIGTDNSYVCAQVIEKHQLAKPKIARVATRTPAGLRLRLLDGKGRTVLVREDPDSSHRFSFREYLGGPEYFLLHRQLHEWTDYVLISARSGKKFTLQERPVVSPDGSRLVAASPGLSGMSPGNAVQVWRIIPGGLQLEFELSPTDWEPSDPRWLNNRTIQLRQQAPLMGDTRAFSRYVNLVRPERRWKLAEPRTP